MNENSEARMQVVDSILVIGIHLHSYWVLSILSHFQKDLESISVLLHQHHTTWSDIPHYVDLVGINKSHMFSRHEQHEQFMLHLVHVAL